VEKPACKKAEIEMGKEQEKARGVSCKLISGLFN